MDQVYGCITGQYLFWQLATHLHARDLVHKAEKFTAKWDMPSNSAVQSFSGRDESPNNNPKVMFPTFHNTKAPLDADNAYTGMYSFFFFLFW